MSGDSTPKQIGETSRRGRGRPRKVPPPPYEDPPPWYPRVTRSLTPEKVAAAEAAYFQNFLRRWARGEFDGPPRSPMMDAQAQQTLGTTEAHPIVVDDDNSDREDVDLGGSKKRPFLGMKPGMFYQMVSMEEDMEISDDENTPVPPQGAESAEERPNGSWPPGWGPGLFKLVPIPKEELVNYNIKDMISLPPLDSTPPPVQDGRRLIDEPGIAMELKEEETVPLEQGPPVHQGISPCPSSNDAEPTVGEPVTLACGDHGGCAKGAHCGCACPP